MPVIQFRTPFVEYPDLVQEHCNKVGALNLSDEHLGRIDETYKSNLDCKHPSWNFGSGLKNPRRMFGDFSV